MDLNKVIRIEMTYEEVVQAWMLLMDVAKRCDPYTIQHYVDDNTFRVDETAEKLSEMFLEYLMEAQTDDI